jgi:hypothetical protein
MAVNSILTNDGLSQSIIAQGEYGYFIKVKSFGVSDVAGALDPSRTTGNTEWYNALVSNGQQINDNTIQITCTIPPSAVGEDKSVEELYIYGEDMSNNEFLLAIAQPNPTQIYTPSATLTFRIQIVVQNIDPSTVYQYIYTQAQEISEHNIDINAHPPLQANLNKFGIYSQEVDREWSGQGIDNFASTAIHTTVVADSIVYWDAGNTRYDLAVQDDSDAQNAMGFYKLSTESVVTRGIVDYTHSYEPFTPLYLSKTIAGAISDEYSIVKIGHTLPNNRIFIDIVDLIKASAYMGAGGGAGSFMPILGQSIDPIEELVDGIDLLGFDKTSGAEIYFNYKLPDGFVSGNQMVLAGGVFYCQNITSGKVLMRAETALLKKGSHVLGIYNDIHTATNEEVDTAPIAGTQTTIGNIDLTDENGEINGAVVEAGDVLRIKVYRDSANETVPADDIVQIVRTCFEPKKVLA